MTADNYKTAFQACRAFNHDDSPGYLYLGRRQLCQRQGMTAENYTTRTLRFRRFLRPERAKETTTTHTAPGKRMLQLEDRYDRRKRYLLKADYCLLTDAQTAYAEKKAVTRPPPQDFEAMLR